MSAIIGILMASAIMIVIEVPALWKKNLKKEIQAFSVLLLFGAGLSIAQILRMKIPNPLDWITTLYKPMSDAIFHC